MIHASCLRSIHLYAFRLTPVVVHYFPALSAFISRFGGQDGGTSNADARALNDKLFPQREEDSWPLVYVHAAVRSWWLAEYSSWYGEHYDGPLAHNKLEEGQLVP